MMNQDTDSWRLLPFTRLPADEQMARGSAMLVAVSGPSLRWRQIAPEALVLGHGQPLASIDLGACRAAGIDVYRRSTGGTAVLSGPEMLSLDVVLPAAHSLLAADVTKSYAWLGQALAAGLAGFGIEATAVSPEAARSQVRSLRPNDPLRLVCYACLSPYEVTVGDRKLVGLAQARRKAGALLQAGLLLRWRPERLAPLLATEPAGQKELAVALRPRAVGLEEVLSSVDQQQVMQALTASIGSATGMDVVETDWSPAETAAITAALPGFEPLAGVRFAREAQPHPDPSAGPEGAN